MANKAGFSILPTYLLMFAMLCLVGHHVVDAFGVSCQAPQTADCSAESSNSFGIEVSSNNWKEHIIHAGFEMPQVAIAIVFSFLCLFCGIVYIFPTEIKPLIPSPPPQKFLGKRKEVV